MPDSAAILLDKLVKKIDKQLKDDLNDLYHQTYSEAYSLGQQDQKEKCGCDNPDLAAVNVDDDELSLDQLLDMLEEE